MILSTNNKLLLFTQALAQGSILLRGSLLHGQRRFQQDDAGLRAGEGFHLERVFHSSSRQPPVEFAGQLRGGHLRLHRLPVQAAERSEHLTFRHQMTF